MRYCEKCGHENKNYAKFCTKCGNSLSPQDMSEIKRNTKETSLNNNFENRLSKEEAVGCNRFILLLYKKDKNRYKLSFLRIFVLLELVISIIIFVYSSIFYSTVPIAGGLLGEIAAGIISGVLFFVVIAIITIIIAYILKKIYNYLIST